MGVLCKNQQSMVWRKESLARGSFRPKLLQETNGVLLVGFSSFREYNNMNQIITLLLKSRKRCPVVK